MTWAHLHAFAWVRWRVTLNQFRRAGALGTIIATLMAAVVSTVVVLALLGGALVGRFVLGSVPAGNVMVAWDIAVAAFAVFWFVGLMTELQHADGLSLDRFLHLPVSPAGAFVINYLGSSVSGALVFVLPAMTGLAIGLTVARGPFMLLLFPLVAAFFLMMTALAYQFRAWLASLMATPRRRRAVLAIVPALFVLAGQVPNLMRTLRPTRDARRTASSRSADREFALARTINRVAPPAWLAYGAEASANHQVTPALAALLGMTLIGTLSLRRSYTTTLRLYTGDFDRTRRPAAPPATPTTGRVRSQASVFMERRVPWTSDPVAAVALASIRAWLRAPELKMTLLTPVFMLAISSRMFMAANAAAGLFRPLTTAGLMAFVLIFGMAGPVGNQFGYDRAGFRAFVLGPARRQDILVGKNLSTLPFAVAIVAVLVAASQWFRPLRADHLVGLLLQFVPMYLLLCLTANVVSIYCPLTLKPGSSVPLPHQGARTFGHIVSVFAVGIALSLTFIPIGVEILLSYLDRFTWFPAYLVLGAAQAAAAVPLYRRVVAWQGRLLQQREQDVLEIVAARAV